MTSRHSTSTGNAQAKPTVVIAGMGDTGVLVAIGLAKHARVVGVATRPALVSGQELGNRLARPDHWRTNYFIDFRRFRRLDQVQMLHGRITNVDAEQSTARIELADGSVVSEPYDVLVIASGVTNGFWRHGQVQSLQQVECDMSSVAERLSSASSIAVVGGGATGVSAAIGLARKYPEKQIHLFHSGEEPIPNHPALARRWVVEQFEQAGVHQHQHHRADIAPDFLGDALTTGPVRWSTGQEPFEADITLWAIGRVRPNSGFLPTEMLDKSGFVRVDEHLRVPGYPNIFAVGDIAASDPARSSARNWGSLVVVRNVRSLVRGRGSMRRFRAPENRWGSILGLQDDGMVVFQPSGRSFRVPRWAVQPVLFRGFNQRVLYRGLRTSDSTSHTDR